MTRDACADDPPSATPSPSISLVFPMFNERANIDRALDQATRILKSAAADFEIIIVDDGSSDGSPSKVQEWQQRFPQIRLVQHPCNQGYGAALRTGFSMASKSLVGYTDIDLPVDLELLHPVLEHCRQFDAVIGYRSPYGETHFRWVRSRIYNRLVQMLFRLNVRDVNFSFKVFPQELLRRHPLRSASCLIDAELLLYIRRMRYRVLEVPVPYQKRQHGRSKLTSIRKDLTLLRELWQLYRNAKPAA